MEKGALKEYMEYLSKQSKMYHVSKWEAHQWLLTREVGREYGLSEQELIELDESLAIKQNHD